MPLGEHADHWANYLGELIRELPLHHPSWRQVPPEEKAGVMARIRDEMLRLQGLGSNTETGVPYTEDEIMAIVRWGKQRGAHSRSDDMFSQMLSQLESQPEIGGGSRSGGCGDDEQGDDEDDGEDGEDEDDS
ncbi:hypothetical protein Tco_1345908 [Tanacetum coccineum]